MLKAVIFDFDGVVADSEPLHLMSFNKALAEYGVNISKDRYYAEYLGYTDLECLQAVSRDFNMSLDAEGVGELIRRKTEIFDELAKKEDSLIDGAVEFIKMLSENNVRLAICSGALLSDIELMLDGTDLPGLFETIVATDHIVKGKPDPEGYLLTLENLNKSGNEKISAGACVVIEDSHWGLEAARSAGMKTVAVANTYPADELDGLADKVAGQISDITIDDLRSLCL